MLKKGKSKIAKHNKDLDKTKNKFENLKSKGDLSEKDELKWRKKILKKEKKSTQLQKNLETAQKKYKKLN